MAPRPLLAVPLVAALALAAASVTASASPTRAGAGLPPHALSAGPFVRVDGVLTRYRVWGDHGSPIVLVHGFVESTYAFTKIAPLLARNHVVYALDLRGFGYSQRLGPYTASSYADQLQAFMRRLHIRRPLLVGHSMGAGVLAAVALRAPRSIRGLVFLSGDGLGGKRGEGFLGPFGRIFAGPLASVALSLVMRSDAIMRAILIRAYGPHHPPLTHRLIQIWRRPFLVAGSAAALAEMTRSGDAGISMRQLGTIHVPARLVWGGHDELPLDDAHRVSAALHGAPLTVIADGGHLSLLTDPIVVAGIVARFDDSLGP